jgi:hypothetical protein
MESNIAVITVPLSEWSEVKNQLENIGKCLLALEGKSKSEYITPKEVCELMKCSRNTYESYIRQGILKPIKVKSEKYSKLLFKRVDIDYFLAQRINAN